jgi:hypothetical protein
MSNGLKDAANQTTGAVSKISNGLKDAANQTTGAVSKISNGLTDAANETTGAVSKISNGLKDAANETQHNIKRIEGCCKRDHGCRPMAWVVCEGMLAVKTHPCREPTVRIRISLWFWNQRFGFAAVRLMVRPWKGGVLPGCQNVLTQMLLVEASSRKANLAC